MPVRVETVSYTHLDVYKRQPRACSFWVEMPISQPRPNSPPSVKRVERPNGLVIEKTAVPMGVIAIIYESRPNVTSDAAALGCV